MRSPTALRILRNGSSAASRSLVADVLAVAGFGGRIERPDLHGGHAFGQQRLRQFVGMVQEALQVLVRPGVVPQAPVRRRLVGVAADVLVAGAGVVDADRVAALAAQRRVHGHAGRLAEHVPQRDVDGRVAARLDAGAAPAEIAGQVAVARLDGQRVLPHQARRRPLVQVGLDGLRAHEGLAQPDQALVGVQAHPEDVGKLTEPDGFELGDLGHGRKPHAHRVGPFGPTPRAPATRCWR